MSRTSIATAAELLNRRASRLVGRTALLRLACCAAALSIVLAACGAPPTPTAPQSQSQSAAESQQAPSAAPQEVVATVSGQPLTREMLDWFVEGAQAPGFAPGETLTRPKDGLRNLVEDCAVARVAARRFDELGLTLSSETLRSDEAADKRMLRSILFRTEILDKTSEATEQEIQDYYGANSRLFIPPFSFDMRHIFASNYVSVETKEGDTLEKLAQEISGDVAMVDRVLIDSDAKSPRAPGYSTGDRATIKPLEPGELLLVPAGPEVKKKNLEKIEEAKRRIEAGEDFMNVAKEVSDAAQKGEIQRRIGLSGRPPLPEIVEQVRKTDVGKTTDVFETKHGYNLILVEAKTDDRAPPLDEKMTRQIRDVVTRQKRDRRITAFLEEAFDSAPLKVDYDLFKDPDTPSTVPLVTLGDTTYSWETLRIPSFDKASKKMTDDDVKTYLKANAILRNEILALRARADKLDRAPHFQIASEARVNQEKRQVYLEHLRKQIETEEIGEAEAKVFFAANPSEFTKPPTYTYHLLAIRTKEAPATGGETDEETTTQSQTALQSPEDTLLTVSNLIRGVDNVETFKAIVREHSDIPGAAENDALFSNTPEKDVPKDLLKELESAAPGTIARPIATEGSVMTAWLVSRTEAGVPTYEEAKANLPDLIHALHLRDFPKAQIAEMLEEAQVVWK
ncbi:peptidyl-prolyl cis-trans isomerase [Candidatus Sumerlaeota bacterium]|nr:peptidyl-prolyl cis-trans isomerase [Candidatus Sumerlaeota bacterium]